MTSLASLVELNPKSGSQPEPAALIGVADIDALTGTVAPRQYGPDESGAYRRRAREGDVLFARISPSMENGKVAVVPPMKTATAAVSGELLVLRPRLGVDPRFVWAFLRQRRLLLQLAKLASGSAGYRRLDARILMEIEVPRDQDRAWGRDLRILAHLDEALSLRRQALERARRLTGAAALSAVDGVTGSQPLSHRATLRSGTPEGSEEVGEVPVLLVSNLRDGSIEADRLRYVTDRGDLPGLRRGDLLLARAGRGGSQLTQAAVYDGTPPGATFASHLIRIRPGDIDPDFLWAWLQTEQAKRSYLVESSNPGGNYRLTLARLRALPVPVLPPRKEEAAAQVAEIVRRVLAASNRQTEQLKDAVQAHLERTFPGSEAVPPEGMLGFDAGTEEERHTRWEPPDGLGPIFAAASYDQRQRWRRAASMGDDFRTAELIFSEQERASVQHTLSVLEQLGVVVREREGVIDHWRLPESADEEEAGA